MPDFEKMARLTVDALWRKRVSPDPYTQAAFDTAAEVIATALRQAYRDGLEEAAKCADDFAVLRAQDGMSAVDMANSCLDLVASAIRAKAGRP